MNGEQSTVILDVPVSDAGIGEVKGKKKLGYIIVKRLFDFFAALLAGIVLLIPMAVIAGMIVLKDRGSPFYMQRRVGKGGEEIRIAKFRTMRMGADKLEDMLTPAQLEEYKKEFKLHDDPRLIGYEKPGDGDKCFGARLRQLSIDELPQILWNICIKGNMSFVGPRPILREELEIYYTPEQQKSLLSVKPGLTGLWQVTGRNDCTYGSGERQRIELRYISERGIWTDVKIILKTFGTIFHRGGVY